MSLVKFFQNPDTLSSDWYYWRPGRGPIVRNVKRLHQWLVIREQLSSSSVVDPSSDPAQADRVNIAAWDFLNHQSTNSPAESIDTFSKFIPSLKMYSCLPLIENKLPILLLWKKLFFTIPPTSVEAKRVFSAVGLFFTKLRTSLSYRSIDRPMFLRFLVPFKGWLDISNFNCCFLKFHLQNLIVY